MTQPDPIAFDDEDPFADSFASFDEQEPVAQDAASAEEAAHPAEEPLAMPHEPDGCDMDQDASVEPLSKSAEQDAFDLDLAEDAAASKPTDETGEPVNTTPAADDAPFDWFADFPRAEPQPAAAPVAVIPQAPTADLPASAALAKAGARKPLGWLSGFARPSAVSVTNPPLPSHDEPTPAPIEDREVQAEPIAPSAPALELEPTIEPETLASAPTVPADFDDALTEAAPFDLFAAPAEDDYAEFSQFEPVTNAPAASPVAEMIATAEAALGDAVVPRIAIHVFAQRAETAAVAQTAAADRRLQRASTAIRPGGLPEALALYGSSPTPALVIVENTAPAMELLADLDRLAEVCDPGTKVVVIGEANDIGLYRELIRRGVSEYLVPPLNPLQLIRTIGGLYADPAAPFLGRTIAFVGAKGGVGSSTLAHNFAWCLSERIEAQACIVDYDLAFGTAGLDFNQDPVQGLHDALTKPDRLDPTLIDRLLARCSERLSLFAAPATLDHDYEISADAYEEVAGKIRSTAPFMVLDLPHVWSGWMRKTLLSADDVVLVAQPDLASLRNAKNMIELITKARPNDAPPRLVLNQVGLPGRPEIPLKEFGKALGMEPALIVPFDAKLFGVAANNGQMIGEVNPKAKAAEAMLQFAQAITRRDAAVARPKSLVERLLKGA